MGYVYSNTTFVKVKSIKSHVRGFKNRIQIQHLLKLNPLKFNHRGGHESNSNTTFVKVKLPKLVRSLLFLR